MSHSLAGKKLNDVLVELWGAHLGRNHFPSNDAPAPQIRGQLFGADAATTVVLEQNLVLEIVGTNNSGAIGSTPVRGGKILPTRTATDWTIIGAFTVATGMVVVLPPASVDPYGLRLRISAIPASPDPLVGGIELATEWS